MQIEGIEKGANDYLIRPFVPKELLVRIQWILQQREILKTKILQERAYGFIGTLPVDRNDLELTGKAGHSRELLGYRDLVLRH